MTTSPPKISVIVPVYNVAPYLPRCIESLLAQTLPDFELLIVDDGSTDQTGEVCDAFAGRDSRIRVWHRQNAGVSAARLFGLQQSCAEYVALVDGDDYVASDYLRVLYDTAIQGNFDTVECRCFRDTGERIYPIQYPIGGIYTREEIPAFFKQGWLYHKDTGRGGAVHSFHSKIFRREVLEMALPQGLGYRVGEDAIVCLYALYHCTSRYACIPDILYYYVRRPGQVMGNGYEQLWGDNVKLFEGIQALDTQGYFNQQLPLRILVEAQRLIGELVANGAGLRQFCATLRSAMIPRVVQEVLFQNKDFKREKGGRSYLLLKYRLYPFLYYYYKFNAKRRGV